ncbi:MAG TPA: alpha/beta hydrolase [Caulobacterales bacterium]|nr:alpha/beta hydrolase [Caulobacterales bacterium]
MRQNNLIAAAALVMTLGAAHAQAPTERPFAGTGAFPALSEPIANLPTHTIYRPSDVRALKGAKLPIIAWGNSNCANDNSFYRPLLTEIASHGYVVVAIGPWNEKAPAPPGAPAPGAATQPSQLIDAINWAQAENVRKGSALEGVLDTEKIAVAGHSCGGVQALFVSPDPRIKTSLIMNSGINGRPSGARNVQITKDTLNQLHAPIAYLIGGPSDIAYANAMDDFARIDRVPAVIANLPLGHMGNYGLPMGGPFAPIAIAWLDWQLKGDRKAKAVFAGARCGLCGDPAWSVQSKKLQEVK